jgi:hypothetical protein
VVAAQQGPDDAEFFCLGTVGIGDINPPATEMPTDGAKISQPKDRNPRVFFACLFWDVTALTAKSVE